MIIITIVFIRTKNADGNDEYPPTSHAEHSSHNTNRRQYSIYMAELI